MRLQFSLSLSSSSSVHPFCFSHPSFIFLSLCLSSSTFLFLHVDNVFLVSLSSLTTSSPSCLSNPSRPSSFFHVSLSCNPATFPVGDLCVLCAPVYVYIAEANQHKIANPLQTPVDKQHTNTPLLSRQHLPPNQRPCGGNYMDPDWLTRRDAVWQSVSVCARVAVWWFSRVPSFLRGNPE